MSLIFHVFAHLPNMFLVIPHKIPMNYKEFNSISRNTHAALCRVDSSLTHICRTLHQFLAHFFISSCPLSTLDHFFYVFFNFAMPFCTWGVPTTFCPTHFCSDMTFLHLCLSGGVPAIFFHSFLFCQFSFCHLFPLVLRAPHYFLFCSFLFCHLFVLTLNCPYTTFCSDMVFFHLRCPHHFLFYSFLFCFFVPHLCSAMTFLHLRVPTTFCSTYFCSTLYSAQFCSAFFLFCPDIVALIFVQRVPSTLWSANFK